MIIPQKYQLAFEPNLKNFTFIGEEKLSFTVKEKTKTIILDARELEITVCELANKDNTVRSFLVEEKNEQLVIHFAKELQPGDYSIKIVFTGKLLDSLAGWYKSSYFVGGEKRYIITSHFEPADARSVFPCVDHPSFKAIFEVSFLIDKNLTAISNTLPVSEEHIYDKKKIVFSPTPKMSTYLLYLAVGEFEFLEEKYNNIVIRGITTPGKKEYTKFALDCAKKFLAYFENYFGYPYPLEKVDLLAIPDFAAGAMENWGAITFRENLLLYYEEKSSITTKQRIAEVTAHELAHQWFGNLVTMKWWDDLWLNESFATFMAYKAVHAYFPAWDTWSDYILETAFVGMDLDALHSSHPIQVHVNHVAEINELFDEIAYDKGGSILRMLEGYVGEDTYRDGLRKYIKTYAYTNTEGKNLWEVLEETSKKPVSTLMQSFITQTGFPILSAELSGKKLQFQQKRFTFQKRETIAQTWEIPVVMQSEAGEKKYLLEKETDEINFAKQPEFINCNENYMGFYITEYTSELLQKLVQHKEKVKHLSKLGILHDVYSLVLSTRISLLTFLEFTKEFLENETDAAVLFYSIARISRIFVLTQNEGCKQLAVQLAEAGLKIAGYEPKDNEHPHNSYVRSTALYTLSLVDHEAAMQFALEKFTKFTTDNNSLHPDLKSIVYSLAVWSDDMHYASVLNHYKNSDIQEEKARFLQALGNTKNKKLLNDTLEYSLSPEVRFANILYTVSAVSRNPHANELALDWLFKNWEILLQTGGGMAHMILRRILKMIIPICGINREKEVAAFIKKHQSKELQKTFEQIWEELEINGRFVRDNKNH